MLVTNHQISLVYPNKLLVLYNTLSALILSVLMTKFVKMFTVLRNSDKNKGRRSDGRNSKIQKLYSTNFERKLFTSFYTFMNQGLDKTHITDVYDFDLNDTTEDFIEVIEFQC